MFCSIFTRFVSSLSLSLFDNSLCFANCFSLSQRVKCGHWSGHFTVMIGQRGGNVGCGKDISSLVCPLRWGRKLELDKFSRRYTASLSDVCNYNFSRKLRKTIPPLTSKLGINVVLLFFQVKCFGRQKPLSLSLRLFFVRPRKSRKSLKQLFWELGLVVVWLFVFYFLGKKK